MAAPQPYLKPALLTGGLAPAVAIFLHLVTGTLAAEPVASTLNRLGLLALVFLVASLACTPAKRFLGWTWPMRIRRMLGLFAFFYALAHVLTYAVVDQGLHLRAIAEDVLKRKFIFVGFAAFVLLVPLAWTSTNAAVKRMGYAKWQRLHRLVYPAALLAVLHFVWRVKKDLSEPLLYAAIVGALLLLRVLDGARKRAAKASRKVAAVR